MPVNFSKPGMANFTKSVQPRRTRRVLIGYHGFGSCLFGMGIHKVGCPFSLEGEDWDEGEYNQLILFSSSTLSATAPALLYLPTSM